jgi:hypothetical protein
VRLGFCLSTIFLAGALTVSGSWAEEAVPAAKKTASPPANAGGPKSISDGGAANNAGGKARERGAGSAGKADTAGAKGKAGGSAPIDTSITVQPTRTVKKPPLGSGKKAISPAAPPSANSARQIVPHEMSGPARNAIGVSPPHGTDGTDGVAKNAAGTLGSYGSVNRGNIVRPSSIPPIAGSAPHNNAALTGTGMRRPGSGPATLGGAAKNVTAVNGTNIRPKQ